MLVVQPGDTSKPQSSAGWHPSLSLHPHVSHQLPAAMAVINYMHQPCLMKLTRILDSVDLPLPLVPMIACVSPSRSTRDTPRRIWSPPTTRACHWGTHLVATALRAAMLAMTNGHNLSRQLAWRLPLVSAACRRASAKQVLTSSSGLWKVCLLCERMTHLQVLDLQHHIAARSRRRRRRHLLRHGCQCAHLLRAESSWSHYEQGCHLISRSLPDSASRMRDADAYVQCCSARQAPAERHDRQPRCWT